MPAPVRYGSTAAVYDAGGVDRGTTRARGNRSASPLPRSVTGSIVTLPHPSTTAAVNPAYSAASILNDHQVEKV